MNPETRLFTGAILERIGTAVSGFSGIAGFIIANQNGIGSFPPLAVVLIVFGSVLIVLSKTFFSNAWTDLADKEQEKQIELARRAEAAQAAEQRAKTREAELAEEAKKSLPKASREALTTQLQLLQHHATRESVYRTIGRYDDPLASLSYHHPEFLDSDITFEDACDIVKDL